MSTSTLLLVEFKDRLIAQQIHIGGGGIEQHLLLGDAQRLARGIDLAFRLPGLVGGLKAVEERLRRRWRRRCANRMSGRRCVFVGPPADHGNSWRGIGVIVAAVGGEAQLRPVARQRLRHVLVDRAQRCALRVKRRIVLIGLHQRPFERIGRSLPSSQCQGRRQPRRLATAQMYARTPHIRRAPALALPASPQRRRNPAANRAGRRHASSNIMRAAKYRETPAVEFIRKFLAVGTYAPQGMTSAAKRSGCAGFGVESRRKRRQAARRSREAAGRPHRKSGGRPDGPRSYD